MKPEERDDMLIETHTLTKQVHGAVFGNGRIGLKTRMDRLEGAWCFVVGLCMVIGVVVGIVRVWQ